LALEQSKFASALKIARNLSIAIVVGPAYILICYAILDPRIDTRTSCKTYGTHTEKDDIEPLDIVILISICRRNHKMAGSGK
jgi:hypothetical protein